MISILKRLTLVEMAVIISIIALAIAIVRPMFSRCYFPYSPTPRGRTRARLDQIAYRMDFFYYENHRFPNPARWKNEMALYFQGLYRKGRLVDGWDNELVYIQDKAGQHFIYSFGANGLDESMEGDDLSYILEPV